MKLQNKKTGEIREIKEILIDGMFNVKSLAELNEEWEDYEEPKRGWFIDLSCNDIQIYEDICLSEEASEKLKLIGNYFDTKEEAEKAVEKLKAWKRLKDEGFKFDGWDENHHNLGIIEFSFDKVENSVWDFEKDLDLLFGGE